MTLHTNRLSRETSPYLLQHAHNPVDWMPYSQEVFRKATLENKPILFSIGYSACHWCHVMEHESFEDESVAAIMNKHFICVKVDREERPDVDHLYMDAVQQLSGRGGWPLNCFALPDGRPFWGGTYFRKEQWKEILTQIADLYKDNFTGLEEQAKQLTEGIAGTAPFISSHRDITFTEESVNVIIVALTKNFDTLNGGFTGAPKFPMPGVLELLLKLSATGKHPSIRHHLELTLEKMARGGIYDWVGGGFARYSVDAEWKVPHFEKMLYDNAQLISLYSKAFQLTKNNLFKEVAVQSLEFVDRELTSPDGLFYCSLDADSEGVEGKYYTWTLREFHEAVAPYGELLGEYFGIDREGLWESEQNILLRPHDEEPFAQSHFLSVTELTALKAHAQLQLFRQREARVRPGLDDKILVSWNSLMIIALVNAYLAFGDRAYLRKALKTCEVLIENARKPDGRIIHSIKEGPGTQEAFLEDYAFLGKALLDLYGASFDERYFNECIRITGYALSHFRVPGGSMFYFSEANEQGLPRKTETYDGVIPSSNSVTAALLAALGNLAGNSGYQDLSKQLLSHMASTAKEYPSSYSGWCSLLLDQLQPPLTIAIVGKEALPLAEKLKKNFLYTSFVTGTEQPSPLPYFVDRYVEGKTLIYICTENSCMTPIEDTGDAFELIKKYYRTII